MFFATKKLSVQPFWRLLDTNNQTDKVTLQLDSPSVFARVRRF